VPSSNLLDDLDTDRLAEAALAILSLILSRSRTCVEGLGLGTDGLLHDRSWIVDPRSKARSLVLTEEGERLAQPFLRKHFDRQ
jgi:hypothetical protein